MRQMTQLGNPGEPHQPAALDLRVQGYSIRSVNDFGNRKVGPMSGRTLDAFFRPRNVAVIGATERPGTVGRAILWNLMTSPFGGAVLPVNPKRASVLGIKAYPAFGRLRARWTWQ